MLQRLRDLAFVLLGRPDGAFGLTIAGPRRYVGGRWETLSRLQLQFVIEQGLRPDHCLLDIGCGSLRAGAALIRYLEPDNYLGLEKERRLVEYGIERELGRATLAQRRPQFVISDTFEFERFTKQPDYCLAQSVFTHLTPDDILACLTKLHAFVRRGTIFYATFYVAAGADAPRNPHRSHAHRIFRYRQSDIEAFGTAAGWTSLWIGEWGHPQQQQMMQFTAF
jgi:hypothetical protein